MEIITKQILLLLSASILLQPIPASANQDCPGPKNVGVKQIPISEAEAQKLFQENADESYSVSKTVLVKQTSISEAEAQKLFGQAPKSRNMPVPYER